MYEYNLENLKLENYLEKKNLKILFKKNYIER